MTPNTRRQGQTRGQGQPWAGPVVKLSNGAIDASSENMAYLERLSDEVLRKQGRVARVVQHQLRRGEQPALEDVTTALKELAANQVPPSYELAHFAGEAFNHNRKRGRRSARTPTEDLTIVAVYHEELARAPEGDGRTRKEACAARATAERLHLTATTVARVVKHSPWKLDNKSTI